MCFLCGRGGSASEAYWELPSSPIVESRQSWKKDMCVFYVVVVAVVVVVVDDVVDDVDDVDDDDVDDDDDPPDY